GPVRLLRPHQHPRSHLDSLPQAELPLAPPVNVKLQRMPLLANTFLPRCQSAGLLVVVLRDLHTPLNCRDVVAGRILLNHATHTELRGAGTNCLFHIAKPAVRNVIFSPLKEGRDDLFFEQAVEREAIGFGLDFLIMILALLANGPAVVAVVTFGPPAVENAAIWLAVEGGLLAAGATGFVGADRVVQPEVRAGNKVARHLDIIVFQENDLATELIAARRAINLFNH